MEVKSLSLFFYTGDFIGSFKRFSEGGEQSYATHDEICRLAYDLMAAGFKVRIYSFLSPTAFDIRFNGVRFTALGAKSYADVGLLRRAVDADDATHLIPHFANLELYKAVLASVRRTPGIRRRTMAVLANSYYRRNPRGPYQRYRVARLLNNDGFDLVANHCVPSTMHLAKWGFGGPS